MPLECVQVAQYASYHFLPYHTVVTEVETNENEVSFYSNSEARALINPLQKAGFFRRRSGHEQAVLSWMRHLADRDKQWLSLRPWQMVS